jgi:quercetin dioxygenase-like cupin family protein
MINHKGDSMMQVLNVKNIKKKTMTEFHGETALYQNVIGEHFLGPDLAYFSMWMIILEPKADNKRHLHQKGEQYYLVLEGFPTIELGDERRDARPWDLFHIPAKVPHRLSNNTEKTCVVQGLGISHRNFLLRYMDAAIKILQKKIGV